MEERRKAEALQEDHPHAANVGGIRYPGIGKMLLVWSVIGLLTAVRHSLPLGRSGSGSGGVLPLLIACVLFYSPWAILTPLVFRLERKFRLGLPGWPARLALLAAISVPFCLAVSPIMVSLYYAPFYAVGNGPRFMRFGNFLFGHFPSAQLVFWCSVAGGYFLRTSFQLREHEQRAARLAVEKSQLEASLTQAQLEALRARLNPHFLFNSLQNISVLIKQDPHTASRMLTILGDLLRAVLRRHSQPESTLAEEIELTRSYVDLEQMRFGERLLVTFDIADGLDQAMAPTFLMQPLLENAILHGLRGVRKTGIIGVRAIEEEDQLVITVADNGIGPPADSAAMKIGVGLGSTYERLTKMYPERHCFSIRRPPQGGAEVRIAIPLRFAGSIASAPRNEASPVADR
jgi:sensor histidine kinase YesM